MNGRKEKYDQTNVLRTDRFILLIISTHAENIDDRFILLAGSYDSYFATHLC